MTSSGLDVTLLRDAVREGRPDVVDVAHEVGASAAQMGVPLCEVLDHVERAYAPDDPPFAPTQAACVAWAEKARLQQAEISCEDPLTSLATAPYLRCRLAEIYRGAAHHGGQAADAASLVVVELPRIRIGHELEQALQALEIAEVLRMVFVSDETVAQLSPRRFVVLAHPERCDRLTLRLLGLLLDRTLGESGSRRIWVESLPRSADGVAHLLAGLSE